MYGYVILVCPKKDEKQNFCPKNHNQNWELFG